MRGFLNNTKNYMQYKINIIIKMYLLVFYMMNIVFWSLEIYKNKFTELYFSNVKQQREYFLKISSLSSITDKIGCLIFFINVIYLLVNITRYRYRGKQGKSINEYLIISSISLLSIPIISSILTIIFHAPFGNLSEQIILPLEVTVLVLIYTLIKSGYKKVYRVLSKC